MKSDKADKLYRLQRIKLKPFKFIHKLRAKNMSTPKKLPVFYYLNGLSKQKQIKNPDT